MWERVPIPEFERWAEALAFRGDTLYACLSDPQRLLPGGEWEELPWPRSCYRGWRWDPGVIFQADRHTLDRSTDGGQTWVDVLEYGGLPPIDTPGGALLTSDNAIGSGAARSTDGGETWTPAAWPGDGGLPQALLVVDPTPELPTGRIVGAGFGGVAYSDDDGRTWHATEIFAYPFYYSEGGTRITGGPEDGVLLVSLDGVPDGFTGGVWRSEDGLAWDLIGQTIEGGLIHLTAGPGGQVYAWSEESDQVLGSADGGRTWRLLSQSVDPSINLHLNDMTVGPGGRMYVGGLVCLRTSWVGSTARWSRWWCRSIPRPPRPLARDCRIEPNPASGAATVRLTLPSPEAVTSPSSTREAGRWRCWPLAPEAWERTR